MASHWFGQVPKIKYCFLTSVQSQNSTFDHFRFFFSTMCRHVRVCVGGGLSALYGFYTFVPFFVFQIWCFYLKHLEWNRFLEKFDLKKLQTFASRQHFIIKKSWTCLSIYLVIVSALPFVLWEKTFFSHVVCSFRFMENTFLNKT